MSSINTYQGGLPLLSNRISRGQRGSGFLSSMKRMLMPIGKAVLPSLFRGASDLLSGKSLKDTVKRRGIEAGKGALGAVGTTLFGGDDESTSTPPPPPPPPRRRNAAIIKQRSRRRPQQGKGGLSEEILKKGLKRRAPTTPPLSSYGKRQKLHQQNCNWV